MLGLRFTLFLGGCRRLFEGTPAQMLASLEKLAVLQGSTGVCRTHEYTLSNLKFAPAAEPGNLKLINYQQRCEEVRARNLSTLPSTIEQERDINPFLRTRLPAVAQAASHYDAAIPPDDVAVFAAIRKWKNEFK
jgi:hydroxyacylglutathione hydrolase